MEAPWHRLREDDGTGEVQGWPESACQGGAGRGVPGRGKSPPGRAYLARIRVSGWWLLFIPQIAWTAGGI
jgi:hypothetical protein